LVACSVITAAATMKTRQAVTAHVLGVIVIR
jgi:hypothetical protein